MNDTEALDHLSIQQLFKLQTGKNNDKNINIGPLKKQTNKTNIWIFHKLVLNEKQL